MSERMISGSRKTLFFLTVLLITSGACSRKATRTMALYDHVPSNVAQTTLLVEKFSYRNPMVYDSFYTINTDSLKRKFKFSHDPDAEVKPLDKPVAQKEHPLIDKTNKNLDKYNDALAKAMKKYDFPYEITEVTHLDSGGRYEDKNKYRYVLHHRPVLHCFTDPNGTTQLSYRYIHYFSDRQTGQSYRDIELFYPEPWKSVQAIAARVNELSTAQNKKPTTATE